MEPAAQTLIDMGYIHREQRRNGNRGRPGEVILLNPYLHRHVPVQ